MGCSSLHLAECGSRRGISNFGRVPRCQGGKGVGVRVVLQSLLLEWHLSSMMGSARCPWTRASISRSHRRPAVGSLPRTQPTGCGIGESRRHTWGTALASRTCRKDAWSYMLGVVSHQRLTQDTRLAKRDGPIKARSSQGRVQQAPPWCSACSGAYAQQLGVCSGVAGRLLAVVCARDDLIGFADQHSPDGHFTQRRCLR